MKMMVSTQKKPAGGKSLALQQFSSKGAAYRLQRIQSIASKARKFLVYSNS